MRALLLALTCLACTGYGRRVQSSTQEAYPASDFAGYEPQESSHTDSGALNAKEVLATLLLTFNPAAAFNPSTMRSLTEIPPAARARPTQVSHRVAFTRMQEQSEAERVWESLEAEKDVFTRSLRGGVKTDLTQKNTTLGHDEMKIGKAKLEEEFLKRVTAEAEIARSEEAIAAQRALGEEAAAALQGDEAVVAALEKKDKPSGKVAKALKPVGYKSISLVGQGKFVDSPILGGYDLNDAAYMSKEFRDGRCNAVIVNLLLEDNMGADALKETSKEQDTAKEDFPGPLPIIVRTPVVDPLQLAQAKLQGALGVILSISIAGKEKTAELMAAAEGLGLEPLVRVTSAEQVETALELGAKIIVFGDRALPEATELLEMVTEKDKDIRTVADVPFLDVRGSWIVRDAGFDALVGGKSVLDIVLRDKVPPSAVCKGILTKGSAEFGLGMQMGRLEGAKETLGQLMM